MIPLLPRASRCGLPVGAIRTPFYAYLAARCKDQRSGACWRRTEAFGCPLPRTVRAAVHLSRVRQRDRLLQARTARAWAGCVDACGGPTLAEQRRGVRRHAARPAIRLRCAKREGSPGKIKGRINRPAGVARRHSDEERRPDGRWSRAKAGKQLRKGRTQASTVLRL